MRAFICVLLVVFFFPIFSRADSPALSLAVNHACVLGENEEGRREVRCWSHAGAPLKVPAFVSPSAIASNNSTACVLDEKAIRCWNPYSSAGADPVALEKAFADFTDPISLTGGGYHICVVDRAQGLRCVGEGAKEVAKIREKGLRDAFSTYNGGCVNRLNKKTQCWGSAPDLAQFKFPLTDISAVHFGGNYCVSNIEGVRCWGGGGPYGLIPMPTALTGRVAIAYESSTTHQTHVLAITNGKVMRLRPRDSYPDDLQLPDPLLVSSTFCLRCVANGSRLSCSKPEMQVCLRPAGRFTVEHGLELVPTYGGVIRDFLERVSGKVYAEKQALVARLVKLNEKSRGDDSLLILAALGPLIEHTDSEIVRAELAPHYAQLKVATALPSMKALVSDEARRRLALELLQSTLPGLSSSGLAGEAWEEFCVVLGRAIVAGDGETSAVRRAASRARSSVARLVDSNRAKAFTLLWLELIEAL